MAAALLLHGRSLATPRSPALDWLLALLGAAVAWLLGTGPLY